MNELLFASILFSLLVAGCVAFAGLRLRVFAGLRPTGILLLVLVVFHGIGALRYELGELASDPDHAITLFWIQGFMFLCFVSGIWLADQVKPSPPDMRVGQRPETREPVGNVVLLLAIATGAALLIVFEMVRRGGVEAMTQFAQSEGDAAGLTVLRRQVNQPGAYTYVAALLGYGVLPPLALAVLLFGTSERKQWAILWGGLLCGAVAFGRAATLHKSPLVSWIAVIVLGFWFQRGIRVRWLRLVALALALFALLSFLYSWIYGTSYSAGVQSSWDRVTLIPQLCLSLFVKTFPAYHDFMHGHSIGLYHNLVSTEPFVAGQQVVQAYLGTRSTTPNSVWIADGWADFGWAGVVISSLIAGFVLRYLETVLLNMPRSPLSRAGYAFLLVSCISMASQSVPAALLTGGVGIGPIAVLALWWLRPKSRQTAPETKHRLAVAARQGLP